MEPLNVGFMGVGGMLVLIALRVPIGLVLGIVSITGIGMLRSFGVGYSLIETALFDFAAHWSLSAIPMFLLMGAVAHFSGVSTDLFHAARVWLGRLPGGLAVASNMACAGFSAASGSSLATAAAMGRITIPQMIAAGYDKGLSTGVVASAGTLGALIPPSILMVIYSIFAEVNVSQMFIAGVLPGLMTAGIYAAMIIIRCQLNRDLAPAIDIDTNWRERWVSLGRVWPLLALIMVIIGGLYGGWFSATEAGAIGATTSFLIAAFQRKLTMTVIRDSLLEAVLSTSRILYVALGAVLFTTFLAMSGLPIFLATTIGDWALDPTLLVISASIIYLILGMFLDPLGLLLLTLPVFLPMFEQLKLDMIWFGILVVKYIEIGLLTPPVGMNVYVIKSVVGDQVELETIFKGVAWFLGCEVIVVALLIIFPEISLYLPSRME